MAKFKAEVTDAIKEWKVTFDDKKELHKAFLIALAEMKSGDSYISEVNKGVLCEYNDKILFDDSNALFVVCTDAAFDGLSERWETEV